MDDAGLDGLGCSNEAQLAAGRALAPQHMAAAAPAVHLACSEGGRSAAAFIQPSISTSPLAASAVTQGRSLSAYDFEASTRPRVSRAAPS